MGLLSKIFYPIFRRNSTYVAFIVAGGLTLDPIFNNGTAYLFHDVMNKGVSLPFLISINSDVPPLFIKL